MHLMTEYVYRPSRRVNGKRVLSRLFSGRYSLSAGAPIISVALHTPDEQVARKRLRDIVVEKQREAEGLIAPSAMRHASALSLRELVNAYGADLRRRDLAARHVHDTLCRVRRLIARAGWNRLADVRPDSFVQVLGKLRRSAKTQKEYQVSVNAFLNWLVKTEQLPRNPLALVDMIDIRGKQVRSSRAFTEKEITRLLAVADYRRLAYLLLLYTGQRKSEVYNLVWGDVHLDEVRPYALFRDTTTKDKKKRAVPLHQDLAIELRGICPDDVSPDRRVFWHTFPDYKTLRADFERAGIPHKDALGRVVHFHSFRKTWQTLGVTYGVNQRSAQELLGHSDANLTAKVYTDVPALALHTEMAKLPWLGGHAQIHAQKGSKTAHFRQILTQLVILANSAIAEVKEVFSTSEMVDLTGLEPVTFSMSRKRSNQLS
jgi:integrase